MTGARLAAQAVRSAGRAAFLRPGRFRAAVFDVDGLLVDSEPLWARAEAVLLERRGRAIHRTRPTRHARRSIDDTVAVYADRLGHPASAVPALRGEPIDLVKPLYLGVLPRPGAVAFVGRLGARVPLAAASLSCVAVTG